MKTSGIGVSVFGFQHVVIAVTAGVDVQLSALSRNERYPWIKYRLSERNEKDLYKELVYFHRDPEPVPKGERRCVLISPAQSFTNLWVDGKSIRPSTYGRVFLDAEIKIHIEERPAFIGLFGLIDHFWPKIRVDVTNKK